MYPMREIRLGEIPRKHSLIALFLNKQGLSVIRCESQIILNNIYSNFKFTITFCVAQCVRVHSKWT